jgi:aspartate/methionine/tyrosine aminotransferase
VRGLARRDTRLVSITAPHNPTGTLMPREALLELLRLCESLGIHLLVDETYRDLSFVEPLPVAAALSPNAISVSSMSKAYGLPGIRLGWVATRDRALMQQLICVKEQIGICGSVLDEAVGFHAYEARPRWLGENQPRVRTAFESVRDWLAREPLLEWVEPQGGCVCFPRIRAEAGIDTDRFYRALNERHGTYVGPGHWFEQSDRSFRIGYAWPTPEELRCGLDSISLALRADG